MKSIKPIVMKPVVLTKKNMYECLITNLHKNVILVFFA